MFIVVALHNTGHGEAATPIFLTEDLCSALGSARAAESLGYQFYADDTYVAICRLDPERAYSKDGLPWIFIRRCNNGKWKEEWIDKVLQATV